MNNQDILVYSGFAIILLVCVCLVIWLISLVKLMQPGSYRPGKGPSGIASTIVTIILNNTITVILYFLTPLFTEVYNGLEGGSSGITILTSKMIEFSNEFEYHWYFFLAGYLFINIWAISNIITPAFETTPRGVSKDLSSGATRSLVTIVNPILLGFNILMIYGLFWPIYYWIYFVYRIG